MSDLALSLQITLAGMGLVFGAILVLWGLMYGLTLLIKAPVEDPAGSPPDGPPAFQQSEKDVLKARAAAAAVALALAQQGASSAHPLSVPPPSPLSPWQLGMRTRQMTQKGNSHKKEKR